MHDEGLGLSLGYFRGPLDDVLAALEDAGLDGAVLELDGSPSNELYDFAEEVTAEDPALRGQNEQARSGRGRIGPVHLAGPPLVVPIRGDNVRRLRAMGERHAEPEIALNLRVLDDHGTLLYAADVGDNEIWVSRRLHRQAVDAIVATLGERLRPTME